MNTGIPLHPALVHIPLGLAIIMPFFTVLVYILIRQGRLDARSWLLPVILQLVIVAFSFVAMKSGENEEDKVEKVVKEVFIEEHEEAAKVYLATAILSLAALAFGLKEGAKKDTVRSASILLLFAAMGAVMYTGKLGGELVYKHGASSAYTNSSQSSQLPTIEEKDDDD